MRTQGIFLNLSYTKNIQSWFGSFFNMKMRKKIVFIKIWYTKRKSSSSIIEGYIRSVFQSVNSLCDSIEMLHLIGLLSCHSVVYVILERKFQTLFFTYVFSWKQCNYFVIFQAVSQIFIGSGLINVLITFLSAQKFTEKKL